MISKYWDKICRFFYWGWKMRNSYDWDSGFVYEMLQLKLQRMVKACYHDGNHVWSPKSRQYKALVECIELCKRVNGSETPYYDRFTAEFGPGARYRFEPIENSDCVKLLDDNTAFYKKLRRLAFTEDQKLEKQRKERLFHLMAKWSDFWWD